MNKTSSFVKVICFIFFAANLSAQIPRDFEFLDHRSARTEHLESKMLNDDFVFVGTTGLWSSISVNYVNSTTNQIDTILSIYDGETDLMEYGDGTFDIYIYQMGDYDFPIPGFFHVSYDGNNFSVDTLSSIFLDHIEDDYSPHSVLKSSAGPYYFVDQDSLYHGDNSGWEAIRSSRYLTKLFQNETRDNFIYEDTLLVKINNNSFDTIQVMPKRIYEIKNRGDFNDVLMPGMIQTWNDDFSQLIRSWNFEDELRSFYEVHVGDSLLTILSSNENDYKYYTLNEQGDESVLEIGALEDEQARSFHYISETSILAINNYEIEEIITDQFLCRYHSFSEETSFQSRLVGIDSASFVYVSTDTIDIYIQDGDTSYYTYQLFDIKIDYTNNSDTSVEHLNIQSSQVYFLTDLNVLGLNYEIVELIEGDQSQSLQKEFSHRSYPSQVSFGIPGADYRINRDPNRLFMTDVILDTEKLVFDNDLKLFPNPVIDLLLIDSEEPIEELSIYNSQGQLILFKVNTISLNKIDLSTLSAGSYFIKFRFKNKKEFSIQQIVKL